MPTASLLLFADFRLDPGNACLWHGDQPIKLKPKAFEVLRYLVAHAGQLVTREALWQAVWSDVLVSDAVLTVCVREIRRAMRDEAKTPHFIETVHKRGYRFIAAVHEAPVSEPRLPSAPASPQPFRAPNVVGRGAELAQLQGWLARALDGERQIVFITGEPGIGKTVVAEALVDHATATADLWIGRGQCIEHYGAGEAYLPVLQALGGLGRGPDQEQVLSVLRQQAPSWLAQLPALLSPVELAALQHSTSATSRERMLREMAEAVETLSVERCLVLLLEDLHWSDPSTVELLALLARRREPARLFVLGTYRPTALIVHDHPLKTVKQELRLHGQCQEVALPFLSPDAVLEYLAWRFPDEAQAPWPRTQLASTVHQWTDGNPLFMVTMVEYLVTRAGEVPRDGAWAGAPVDGVVTTAVPDDLRQMIEREIDQLTVAEQQLLEAASVVGTEFSAAAVAALLPRELVEVEAHCAGLVRRQQFLDAAGIAAWPDGTIAARYRFTHWLYQNGSYQRLGVTRRSQLHRRLAERLETAFGTHAPEVAAELAVHFEQGREHHKAVHYLWHAAANAQQRHAHQEAATHLTRGLAFVQTWPETLERTQQELAFSTALGPALITTRGHTVPAVEQVYARARVLCQQVGETPHLFPVLYGLGLVHLQRAEVRTAHELGQQLLDLAQQAPDPRYQVLAHQVLGTSLFWLGDLLAARQHLGAALAAYHPEAHRAHAALYGEDPGISCRVYLARVLWMLGHPDRALVVIQEALALADRLAQPFGLAYAQSGAAFIYQLRRESQPAQRWAEAALTLCTEHAFPFVSTWARILRGAALAGQAHGSEGITEMHAGLTAHEALGAALGRPYLLTLVAEAYGHTDQPADGLQMLRQAHTAAHRSAEGVCKAEWYRLTGELLLQQAGMPQGHTGRPSPPLTWSTLPVAAAVEAYFLQARALARQQAAKSWELRTMLSLGRLWHAQGKRAEAQQQLAELYAWFTEGLETPDLRDAQALLAELARS